MIRSLAIVCLLTAAGIAQSALGAPVPVWHTTLNDEASVTSTGGTLVNNPQFVPAAYPAGSINKFQSTGSSTAQWDESAVGSIFAGWDKTKGITVDMYFSGIGDGTSANANGDVGLWSVGKRMGGDNFLILVARNDEFRFNIRDEGGAGDIGGATWTILTDGVNLNPDITYRLTVRQHSSLGAKGDLQIFLESISDGGAQYPAADTPIASLELTGGNFRFPIPDTGTGEPLRMHVGDKYPHFNASGFELTNGDAVDNIRVYNGVYLPSELGTIPEPTTLALLAVGSLVLVRRRR